MGGSGDSGSTVRHLHSLTISRDLFPVVALMVWDLKRVSETLSIYRALNKIVERGTFKLRENENKRQKENRWVANGIFH